MATNAQPTDVAIANLDSMIAMLSSLKQDYVQVAKRVESHDSRLSAVETTMSEIAENHAATADDLRKEISYLKTELQHMRASSSLPTAAQPAPPPLTTWASIATRPAAPPPPTLPPPSQLTLDAHIEYSRTQNVSLHVPLSHILERVQNIRDYEPTHVIDCLRQSRQHLPRPDDCPDFALPLVERFYPQLDHHGHMRTLTEQRRSPDDYDTMVEVKYYLFVIRFTNYVYAQAILQILGRTLFEDFGIRTRHDLTSSQIAERKRYDPITSELRSMDVKYTLKFDGIRPAINTGPGVWVRTESLAHARQVLADLKAARLAAAPHRQARPPPVQHPQQPAAKKACPDASTATPDEMMSND